MNGGYLPYEEENWMLFIYGGLYFIYSTYLRIEYEKFIDYI